MSAARQDIDVSALPSTVFRQRGLLWWGTVGFIAIEGTTLVICAVTYFYLMRNFSSWPPEGTPKPSLAIPTVQAALMALSMVPAVLVSRAGRRLDLAAMRRWMVVLSVLAAAFVVLRWFELQALNTRWDSNAYGSAVWAVLVAHGTLLVVELLEVVPFTVLLFTGPFWEKYFSDAEDTGLYWLFMTGAWLLLYAMVFVYPNLR
jgi:heme/copper-type cytochrome/quinol oxidase subunit 3